MIGATYTCPDCDGSGMRLNVVGEIDVCRTCDGNTVVNLITLRELSYTQEEIENWESPPTNEKS